MSASIIRSWTKKGALYLISALLLMQVLGSVFLAQSTSAVAQPTDDTVDLYNEVIKYQTVAGLVNCMNRKDQDPGNDKITYAQAVAGTWFNPNYSVYIGHLSGGEPIDCNSLVQTVAGYLKSDPIGMFCSFVATTKNNEVPCTDSRAKDYSFDPLDNPYQDVNGKTTAGVPYSKKFYDNIVVNRLKIGALSGADQYYMYLMALVDDSTCSASTTSTKAAGWSTVSVNMPVTQSVAPVAGAPTEVVMAKRTLYYRDSSSSGVDLSKIINTKIVPITGLIASPSKPNSFAVIGKDLKGNTYDGNGGTTATATVQKNTYNISDSSNSSFIQDPKALSIWGGPDLVDDVSRGLYMHYEFRDCAALASAVNDNWVAFSLWMKGKTLGDTNFTAPTDSSSDPDTPSCSIDGIGWILCPVMNFLAGVSDASFNFLADSFLSTKTSLVTADDTNGAYIGWKMMRNVANVLFIIAFLVIVFSQMTGAGITNYGVKKMLPRLVVAAILVNISFLVCQIAVDLSNILGYSLKSFFESIANTAGLDQATIQLSSSRTGGGFIGIVGTVLAIGTISAIGYVYLSALLPILLAALVALLVILFILLTRQVLIVLLIVLAPVAFVAFLLPNTQKWFTMWRKTFVALLLVFPIIAVVYGASALASDILSATFQPKDVNAFGDTPDAIWGQIMAAAVLILPLFVVPGLLKKSLDGIGGLGARITSIGAKVQGGARSKGTEAYNNSRAGQFKAFRKKEGATRRAMVQSGSYSGGGIRGLMSRGNKAINESSISGKFGDQASTTGAALVEKENAEIIASAQANINRKADENPGTHSVKLQFEQALRTGDTVTAKAAQNILMGKGGPGVKDVRDTIEKVHTEIDPATGKSALSADMRRTIANNTLNNHAPTAKQKSNDLLQWAVASTTPPKPGTTAFNGGVDDIASNPDTWKSLSAADLVGQTDSAFEAAVTSGGVSVETKNSIKTGQVSEQLTDAKRKVI